MGMVKAVIGYGIGLVVLGIVLSYLVRAYLRIRRDNVMKLARRDSVRLTLSDSADYEHTFLGTTAHAAPTGPADSTECSLRLVTSEPAGD